MHQAGLREDQESGSKDQPGTEPDITEDLIGDDCGSPLSNPFFNFFHAQGFSDCLQAFQAVWAPYSMACGLTGRFFSELSNAFPFNVFPYPMRTAAAIYETIHRATKEYPEPPYDLNAAEEDVMVKPWASLRHFLPEGKQSGAPVLIVAPMTNNFPSMMRHVARELMVRGHDVYITHWKDAKLVPVSEGNFGLDKYVDYLLDFNDYFGKRINIVAISQAGPPSFVAAALTHQLDNKLKPRTLTVIASPMDTRINPTAINFAARDHSVRWVRDHLMSTVPSGHPGVGRRVYSGKTHLMAAYSQNPEDHMRRGMELFWAIFAGNAEKAQNQREYYDHFNARMDTSARFVLQTYGRIFKRHSLPLGEYCWRNTPIKPEAITNTALLAIEGGQDKVCSPGQTSAMLGWCSNLKPGMGVAAVIGHVGHYGLWNRAAPEAMELVARFIRQHRRHLVAVPGGPA